jgi:hypothetical protein
MKPEESSLQQLRLLSAKVARVAAPALDALLLGAARRGLELGQQEAAKELARRGLRLSEHALSR